MNWSTHAIIYINFDDLEFWLDYASNIIVDEIYPIDNHARFKIKYHHEKENKNISANT